MRLKKITQLIAYRFYTTEPFSLDEFQAYRGGKREKRNIQGGGKAGCVGNHIFTGVSFKLQPSVGAL